MIPTQSDAATMAPGRPATWPILALLLTMVAGIAIIRFSTPLGIGVGYDSVFYLSSAENLLKGNGLQWPLGGDELKPLTHYPPLYPLALAGLGALGMDLTDAAGWLSAVLFGLNVALTGGLVYEATHHWKLALAAALAALASPILIGVHLMAMTEPLFLALLLISLWALMRHLESGSRAAFALAAAAAGMAALTRYIGISLVATGVLAILLFSRPFGRRVVLRSAFFGLLGLIPILAWYGHNWLVAGTAVNRNLLFHPLTRARLAFGAHTFSIWFAPEALSFRIRLAIFAGVAAFAALAFLRCARRLLRSKGERAGPADHVVVLMGLFILAYGLVLLVSLTFVDASTRLNERILSPAFLAALLLIFTGIPFWDGAWLQKPALRAAAAVLWLSLMTFYSTQSLDTLQRAREDGLAFNSRRWRNSETVAAVRNLEPGGILYSTEALPLYYLTGRPAYWVPEVISPLEARPIDTYEENMALMRERLATPGSALVLFDSSFERDEMPMKADLIDGLQLMIETSDGAIYESDFDG